METTSLERSFLQDLALVYIAFAHGTDEDLADAEIRVIAERLSNWRDGFEETTVLSAVKSALEEYLRDDAIQMVEQSIDRIRATATRDERTAVINDLMDIALADDVFRQSEGSFIKELEEAWDLHPDDTGSREGFSVINRSEEHEGWTAMHDLALIYLTLAHGTDHNLSDAEVETITRRLAEWMPDAAESEVLRIIQGAMSVYAQGPDKRVFSESVDSLQRHLPVHQLQAVLDDLVQIAEADGSMIDQERDLIDRLRDALTRRASNR